MGNIFSIRLTDEDKIHLQQRMDETGKMQQKYLRAQSILPK